MKIIESTSAKMRTMSFLCACLVPLIHMTSFDGVNITHGSASWVMYHLIHHGVAMMAVPWFFLASGFFLSHHLAGGNYLIEVKKRISSLIVPMIVWGTLWWLFRWQCDQSWHKCICVCCGLPKYGPLWFLRTLFLFVLLSPVLYRVRNDFIVLSCLFLLSILYPFLLPGGKGYGVVRYFLSPAGLFYFLIGMHFAGRNVSWGRYSFLSIGIGCIVLVLKMLYGGKVWGLYIAFNNLAIPFLLYGIFSMMPSRRLGFVPGGAVMMLMYLSHEFFIFPLMKLVIRIRGFDDSAMFYGATSVLVVCVAYCFSVALCRFFPRLANVLSGGRLHGANAQRGGAGCE